MNIRVGFGYDVHPLQNGYDLWLGGVKLIAEKGAVGHSDADVLIHALCDALLGAANLGDIGQHYPNTELQWKNKDSTFFLHDVTQKLTSLNWRISNADCTICLESPQVNPHIVAMRRVLAPLMNIPDDALSIKATTSEKLGFVGRADGIAAYAVTLITKE